MGLSSRQAYFFAFLLLSIPLYVGIAYYTPRSSFGLLFTEFFLLFLLYSGICWSQGISCLVGRGLENKHAQGIPSLAMPLLLGGAILLRVLFLPSLPNLSDDYFRFVWDGRLLVQGISPFIETPEALMQDLVKAEALGLTQELFSGLNSPAYFTIYPPVNQFIFWLGAYLFPTSISGSVWVMKLCLLLAEVGSLFLLVDLLKRLKLSPSLFLLYAFNPLVIVELNGNLHFEALLIFFLLLSIWTFLNYPYWVAALPFSLAIASKLLPLMFLPLLLRRLGWWKTSIFSLLTLSLVAVMFLPILNFTTLTNLGSSIGLYFQSFEFNASLYYIIRWIGYQEYGYNIIQTAGKNLGIAVFIAIWLYVLLEKAPRFSNLSRAMLWTLFIYFTGATIVHPWYVCTLAALCVLTRYRFPLIWTALLPLTYFTYRTEAYTENLWLVGVSYVLVWGFIMWEFRRGVKRGT